MGWNLTMLVIHMLAAAMLDLITYDAGALFGNPFNWELRCIGHTVEHIAMFTYIFRFFIVDEERRCLLSSSDYFRS